MYRAINKSNMVLELDYVTECGNSGIVVIQPGESISGLNEQGVENLMRLPESYRLTFVDNFGRIKRRELVAHNWKEDGF